MKITTAISKYKRGDTITDKNNVDYDVQRVVSGIPITVLSRRSYGSKEYKTTYTWLSYYNENTNEWTSFGDPWPYFNPKNTDIIQYGGPTFNSLIYKYTL